MANAKTNLTHNMQCFPASESQPLQMAKHYMRDLPWPGDQHTPPPPTNLFYADPYVTPAQGQRHPAPGASALVRTLYYDNSPENSLGAGVDRLADTHEPHSRMPLGVESGQGTTHQVFIEMPETQPVHEPYHVASPGPTQSIRPGPPTYAGYSFTPCVPAPSRQSHAMAEGSVEQVAAGYTPQVRPPGASAQYAQVTGYGVTALPTPPASQWVPNLALPKPQAVLDEASPGTLRNPSHQQPHVLAPHQHARQYGPCTRADHSQHPSLATYGGLMQTHQVKNVQVFTGSPDCRMLVEDWIRDIQYLLEAIELPVHLRFSTVVRHLGGEARNLILNLHPHDQTPERAFEELQAEYGDTRGSLDPLADFYERSQNAGESACSYAIALEAKLRTVEEKQRGGRPFQDRDSKLTRQFMRGLTDEEVYRRIAPMAPRRWSFRELQAELRNLARETMKCRPQTKSNKTYAQVHVATGGAGPNKVDRSKHPSELAELTEMVKKLALAQEEQMNKMAQLEFRITHAPAAPPSSVQPAKGKLSQSSSFVCYRCGETGHTARVCRTLLPDASLAEAQLPKTPADGHVHSAQHLNA